MSAEQPMPDPAAAVGKSVQQLVIEDMQARELVGIERYGQALYPHNGRDMLRDAYEEALDLTTYLRGCIEERDRPASVEPWIFDEMRRASDEFNALPDHVKPVITTPSAVPQRSEPVEACAVLGCDWDARGTAGGSGRQACGAMGGPAPCLVSYYAEWDPEDRPPYRPDRPEPSAVERERCHCGHTLDEHGGLVGCAVESCRCHIYRPSAVEETPRSP